MMNSPKFSITFDSSTQDDFSALGLMLLNVSEEWFRSSLSFWDKKQYQEHWIHSVKRIVDGQKKSALITDMPFPSGANFLFWWPMWNVDGKIYVQNHLFFLHQLSVPFDVSRYYDYVPERGTDSDDGVPISEWTVTTSELLEFILMKS